MRVMEESELMARESNAKGKMAGDTILCNTKVGESWFGRRIMCVILNMLCMLQVPTGHPGGVSRWLEIRV